MGVMNRAALLAARRETRDVEACGATVRLGALSVLRRIELAEAYVDNQRAIKAHEDDQALPPAERAGLPPVRAYDQACLQVLFSVVDEEGAFCMQVGDYEIFQNLAYRDIGRLVEAYLALNVDAPTSEAVAEKKASSD